VLAGWQHDLKPKLKIEIRATRR